MLGVAANMNLIRKSVRYFKSNIETFVYGDIKEINFSNPHTRHRYFPITYGPFY